LPRLALLFLAALVGLFPLASSAQTTNPSNDPDSP